MDRAIVYTLVVEGLVVMDKEKEAAYKDGYREANERIDKLLASARLEQSQHERLMSILIPIFTFTLGELFIIGVLTIWRMMH